MIGKIRDLEGELGGFTGKVSAAFSLSEFENIGEKLAEDNVEVLAQGRHQVVVVPLERGGQEVLVAIKKFGRQSRWKDGYDRKRGSKAQRSYEAALWLSQNEVGTPIPVGYLDLWEGRRLVESYFLTNYVEGLTCFRDELLRMYREDADCHRLVELISGVARFVRRMHDAGFWHRDLGNQNVFMKRASGGGWSDFQTLDLNRGRCRDELTMAQRARDFDRMILPGELLSLMLSSYWGKKIPDDFLRDVEKYRGRYQFRVRTRRFRHPFEKRGPDEYPAKKDIWIWDDRSAQAMIVMSRKERRKLFSNRKIFGIIAANLKALPGVWRGYQKAMGEVYQGEVNLSGRIGMSMECTEMDFPKQVEFLNSLGNIPVLIRFCHHENEDQWKKTASYVARLHESGHTIMLAILQDRRAVNEPESWNQFLHQVLEWTHPYVEMVEVCHAINRTKWGIHTTKEQVTLLEPIRELKKKYPKVKFTGPACIDFEYYSVVSALSNMPEGVALDALSHHLYVDRRGAPENRQGKFSLLEKCALLKAIARWSGRCGDEVVVSEVNWPVKGAGVWSPVDATSLPSWKNESDLNVDEESYGAYMLRYYVVALCSGMVEKVYWWRLVAHGFGLVDERAEGGWRARAGYAMLVFFLKTLGEATFVEKVEDETGAYYFRFKVGLENWVMAWMNGGKSSGELPFKYKKVFDAYGEIVCGEVTLGDLPVYFSEVS